jgi:transcriptional regulator with GAF, ATPase, and Fis domain
VAVNCPTVPENILESELFGYKKGAFTHATQNKIGLFQEADGGTIFLDEIGDISPTIQTKLLRVLQEKEIKPLGDSRSIH